MKKTLTTILAGLALAGCSTIEPRGHVGLGYVPDRAESQLYEDEFFTEIEGGLEKEISEDSRAYIGGSFKSYIQPREDDYTFDINSQEYRILGEVQSGPLTFYGERFCLHPVNETERWIQDSDGEYYLINHRSRTELGVKYKW